MKLASLAFLFIITTIAPSLQAQDTSALNYDTLINKVKANQVAYRTLSMRAKVEWSDEQSDQDFQMNVRMVKDSLVWVSFTGAMGIEGVRALITPDSVRIINKLTSEYIVRDYNYIQRWLLFPVNFKMLQQLITGETIDLSGRMVTAVATEDSLPVLYNETDKLLEKTRVDLLNYTILKILLKDKLLQQDMAINFGDYKPEEGKLFAYKRSMIVNREDDIMQLTVDVTKLRWNEELTFPFEVSEKYKRVK